MRVDVHDDAYAACIAANRDAFDRFGAHFLVLGGAFEAPEGTSRAHNVVIELPSHPVALDCHRSPEHAAVKALRSGAGTCDLVIVAGYDGPQPGA